ncbi:unnamed protein product [Dovyalis caffra]|uniref:Uncharacterized protein n=1 Tax=Dovyalis caffra TaxID=77055 RepID=A0AAV1SV07_9ROSI|nr:unnamed protein product [Dovyalis caffra]
MKRCAPPHFVEEVCTLSLREFNHPNPTRRISLTRGAHEDIITSSVFSINETHKFYSSAQPELP